MRYAPQKMILKKLKTSICLNFIDDKFRTSDAASISIDTVDLKTNSW